jgi:hypothetical protein
VRALHISILIAMDTTDGMSDSRVYFKASMNQEVGGQLSIQVNKSCVDRLCYEQ